MRKQYNILLVKWGFCLYLQLLNIKFLLLPYKKSHNHLRGLEEGTAGCQLRSKHLAHNLLRTLRHKSLLHIHHPLLGPADEKLIVHPSHLQRFTHQILHRRAPRDPGVLEERFRIRILLEEFSVGVTLGTAIHVHHELQRIAKLALHVDHGRDTDSRAHQHGRGWFLGQCEDTHRRGKGDFIAHLQLLVYVRRYLPSHLLLDGTLEVIGAGGGGGRVMSGSRQTITIDIDLNGEVLSFRKRKLLPVKR
mmetsp:Transcript_9629/g.17404  ORF Transcript_9629/g.17404 Transcript_9629/m.17404 type:complete len:248 (+) Transcript_9629:170-913(+)